MVASSFVSCGGGKKLGKKDFSNIPLQRVTDVFAVQSKGGTLGMRLEARVMEHYVNDTSEIDYFPDGVSVFSYSSDGLLESVIVSDEARHTAPKDRNKEEIWSAFGNVIIHNVKDQKTIETDTIYWDRTKEQIYTDCYVKMYSPDGFMQGYGMRSDDRAKNATLFNSFNNYALVVKDTTQVVIDSVNFIGPFQKK